MERREKIRDLGTRGEKRFRLPCVRHSFIYLYHLLYYILNNITKLFPCVCVCV